MELMIELTVMFDNPDIPPQAFLAGPFTDDEVADVYVLGVIELRRQAEKSLKTDQLKEEQCFYRFFRRDA